MKHFAQLIDSAAGLVDAAAERSWSIHRGSLDAGVFKAAAIVSIGATLAILRSIIIVIVTDSCSRTTSLALARASIAQICSQLRLLHKLSNQVERSLVDHCQVEAAVGRIRKRSVDVEHRRYIDQLQVAGFLDLASGIFHADVVLFTKLVNHTTSNFALKGVGTYLVRTE